MYGDAVKHGVSCLSQITGIGCCKVLSVKLCIDKKYGWITSQICKRNIESRSSHYLFEGWSWGLDQGRLVDCAAFCFFLAIA